MMKANWYRNASEKDQDKVHGTGEVVHFGLLERTGEGIAVIADAKGNIHEKPFSLVRLVNAEEQAKAEEQAIDAKAEEQAKAKEAEEQAIDAKAKQAEEQTKAKEEQAKAKHEEQAKAKQEESTKATKHTQSKQK